jgi:hypothetical protein
VCSTELQAKSAIRGHLAKHFDAEIKERFLNKEDPTRCALWCRFCEPPFRPKSFGKNFGKNSIK